VFYYISTPDTKVASFEVSQTNGAILLEAFQNFKQKIFCFLKKNYLSHLINIEIKLITLKYGVRGLENIVKDLNKNPVKLMGYKKNTVYLMT